MKQFPWLLLMTVIAASVAGGQTQPTVPEWKIVGQINGNNIEFKCIEGCAYTYISAGCRDLTDCRWTLDQAGIMTSGDPFDMQKEIEDAKHMANSQSDSVFQALRKAQEDL